MAPAVMTKPRPNLKATVIPKSLMRITCLGDFMKNVGASDEAIRIAQEGCADGTVAGLTIAGIDHEGYISDEATLLFEELLEDTKVSVDVSDGRSMIEAVSNRFGHAVAYSVATMKRKGLSLLYRWHFTPRVNANQELFEATCTRFNLVPGTSGPTHRPGHAPRQLFEIRPGIDKGILYSHAVSRRTKK
ncbi:MAG: hypothetical protein K0U74_12175 [Alphaproteobacteria bacterium]|nr:hypothetical protein [Alphaproteobacteria bacterium]